METLSYQVPAQDRMDKTETLRQILAVEQGSPVSYEEALEVGDSLIEFFKALIGED